MMKLANEFDQLTQIDMMIARHIARCPETKAYMTGSNGRRKYGRPRRYFARRGEKIARVTAYSDEEAVEKLNKRLFPEVIKGESDDATPIP